MNEIPRGKKLVLKDGTFQVVREYQKNGDRVRYFSLERGAWEEIPAAMVDWDATAKTEADSAKSADALLAKVHKQEEAKRMDNVADVDASLRVGQGEFLPDGEGMFVVEGKTLRVLQQVDSAFKVDRKRQIEGALSPVKTVPGKKYLYIAGSRSTLRLRTNSPEFYLREAASDPEHDSGIRKSSRAGDDGPEVLLLKAKPTKNGRQFETLRTLYGEDLPPEIHPLSIQRWEVAPRVYRFTMAEPLPPGEYVLTELLPDGLNMSVWDFGLDGDEDTKKK